MAADPKEKPKKQGIKTNFNFVRFEGAPGTLNSFKTMVGSFKIKVSKWCVNGGPGAPIREHFGYQNSLYSTSNVCLDLPGNKQRFCEEKRLKSGSAVNAGILVLGGCGPLKEAKPH